MESSESSLRSESISHSGKVSEEVFRSAVVSVELDVNSRLNGEKRVVKRNLSAPRCCVLVFSRGQKLRHRIKHHSHHPMLLRQAHESLLSSLASESAVPTTI